MNDQSFVDHYEVLQLSPNATSETVERVYRLLAKRYHPDNQVSGEAGTFAQVHEAYRVLSNPEARTAYDVKYDENRSLQWRIFDQESATDGRQQDRRVFHGILSLLYIARRRDPKSGGMGAINLERLLGISQQDLEFALWYMRQRSWVEVLDTGQLAITVEGVDMLAGKELAVPADRLLAESSLVRSDGATVDRHRDVPPSIQQPADRPVYAGVSSSSDPDA